AEHDVSLLNHLDVAPLHRRFWGYLFFPRGAETRSREIVTQAIGAVFRDLCKRLTQLLIGELLAFGEQAREIVEDPLDGFHIFGFAVNCQAVSAPVDLNVEQRLEVLDVLVVNAEKRFHSPWWKINLLQLIKLSP